MVVRSAHPLLAAVPCARPRSASTGGGDGFVASPPLNRVERAARYTNDFLVHLAVSDGPSVLSIAANLAPLPSWLLGPLNLFNSFNALTSVVAGIADARELWGSHRNPRATRLDRVVDLVHLIGSDAGSAAAAMVPVFFSLSHPAAMAAFVGGQLAGVAMDLAKTGYDIHRKGQQSAR